MDRCLIICSSLALDYLVFGPCLIRSMLFARDDPPAVSFYASVSGGLPFHSLWPFGSALDVRLGVWTVLV